jgi:hypothetical protein
MLVVLPAGRAKDRTTLCPAPTSPPFLDLAGWNCVLCDCPCTFTLPRILVWGTPAHAPGRRLSRAGAAKARNKLSYTATAFVPLAQFRETCKSHVRSPTETGKLQSGSAGLDLRKATCGPVPTYHKPYKVAGPRLSRGIYPPRANQMTSATATTARMMATNARALHAGSRLTPE